MDRINKIRTKTRNDFFSNIKPLKMDLLNDTVWNNAEINIKTKTLQAIQEGRLKRVEIEEANSLKKAGYTVIKGKTLEEWQHYFCEILNNKNIKLPLSSIDEFILQRIFTKQDYGKLIAVICLANNKELVNERTLLDKNYVFINKNL
jgi:hypothetical protein